MPHTNSIVRCRRQRAVSAGVIIILVFGTLAGFAAHYRIWSWNDWRTFREMSRECHPVWRDLYFGRIAAGQDVRELLASTKPEHVEHYGPYVALNFHPSFSYTGLTVVARDQKLVSASARSCTWHRTFFDVMTPQDRDEYRRLYRESHAEETKLAIKRLINSVTNQDE